MAKKAITLTLTLLMLFSCFTTSASALLEESKQIGGYSTDVLAKAGGEIAINFTIMGTGVMDQIGAKKIDIFAQNGSYLTLKASYNQDSEGMTKSDAVYFGNTIYFSGTPGTYYQIYITVFATNAEGSDSRTEVHHVTARS